MDTEDVVAVELDVVLYGEGDVSVDVYLGFEGGVGLGLGRVLPEYGCVEELKREEGRSQLQAKGG